MITTIFAFLVLAALPVAGWFLHQHGVMTEQDLIIGGAAVLVVVIVFAIILIIRKVIGAAISVLLVICGAGLLILGAFAGPLGLFEALADDVGLPMSSGQDAPKQVGEGRGE